MSFYGKTETWKVVYIPKIQNGGMKGVAVVEAADRQTAMFNFNQQYAGQYHVVESCNKLI